MIDPLIRWMDGPSPSESPILRARIRVQHAMAALHVFVGLCYVALFEAYGVSWAAEVLVPLVGASQFALFALTRQGNPAVGGRIISVSVFFFITAALVARGGMMSNAAVWMLMVPLLSTFMCGPRHGGVMSLATAGVYVGLWGAEMVGMPMEPGFSPEVLRWMPVVDYPLIAMIIGLALALQAGVWEGAERVAREAAQARYTFLATMSHEIRTPLNGVLSLTDLLLDSDLDADQRQLAATAHSSGTLLRAVLDDVLDYSKIDSGRLEMERVPVSLTSLCDEVVLLWRPTAEARGLSLERRVDPSVPDWIEGDLTKLRQIVGNLVSNALKFTEVGGVRLEVTAQDDRLCLAVVDTGIGMTPEGLSGIFDAFRQADGTTTRRFGGTGLGLAISRRLARFMDGELHVHSEPGVGSTFELSLPMRAVSPPTPAVGACEQDGGDHVLRVLVAEDNAVNQMVIRRLLERLGHEVLIVPNGREAVAAWVEWGPDLILMDCQMPECDGYEATRRIRDQGGSLPIIALTANSMPGDRARCLAAGMDEHLGKPIDTGALKAVLCHRGQGARAA